MQIKIRKAIKADASFIFNSWLKSYSKSNFAKSIHSTIYFENHHKLIEQLFKTSEVIVACSPEDQNLIYGYMCAEKVDNVFTIHYIYVKQPFRRFGLAREMSKTFDHDFESLAVYTHETDTAKALAEKFNLIYHPYINMKLVEGETEHTTDKVKMEMNGEINE